MQSPAATQCRQERCVAGISLRGVRSTPGKAERASLRDSSRYGWRHVFGVYAFTMHFLNRQPARFCQEENRAGHRITAGSGPSGIFSGEMLRGLFPNQGIFPFSQESKHVAKGICPNGKRQEQKARFVSAVGGYAALRIKTASMTAPQGKKT